MQPAPGRGNVDVADRVKPFDLIIVGGGFSGTCVAVNVCRQAPDMRVLLLEPSDQPGAGSAYGTHHDDHRLNAPVQAHSINPAEPLHLQEWCEQTNLLADDPDALTVAGLFIRRRDFARYLLDCLSQVMSEDESTGVTHRRAWVTAVDVQGGDQTINNSGSDAKLFRVSTADGPSFSGRSVVLATGNPVARLPAVLGAAANHPGLIADPWARNAYDRVDGDADVAVLGAGLTAADQICTLVAGGHRGPIHVFSRHGLRPTQWAPPDPDAADGESVLPADLLAIINGPPAAWIQRALAQGASVRRLTRGLRNRLAELVRQGERWQAGFDELRDVVWQVWPQLPDSEKQRFLKKLRPWYDVYRFRIPPQTEQILGHAQARGQLRFYQGRLRAVVANAAGSLALKFAGPPTPLVPLADSGGAADQSARLASAASQRDWAVGSLVNCTGFDLAADPVPDSLYDRLIRSGLVTRHPTGIGYCTDRWGRSISMTTRHDGLRLVGPPTAGQWGDPLGGVFIAAQVLRMLPDLLACLRGAPTNRT